MKPRTIVYVDGFNLYYGAVRGTTHKWLDIGITGTATYYDARKWVAVPHYHHGVPLKYMASPARAMATQKRIPDITDHRHTRCVWASSRARGEFKVSGTFSGLGRMG